jgi:hypothetical protein
LLSQGLSVTLEESAIDPAAVLAQWRESSLTLPNLALVEIGELTTNPYDFCRSCRAAYPEMAIVLTNSKQQEISAPEQRWAIFQGVQDLLPGFLPTVSLAEITTRVARVLEILGWRSLREDALKQRLSTIPSLRRVMAPPEPSIPLNPLNDLMAPLELPPKLDSLTPAFQPLGSELVQPKPASTKAKKPKRPPDDSSDGMIYRGVRVK